MNVYLASRFSSKQLMRAYADDLAKLGIAVTSSWLQETAEPNSQLTDFSTEDLEDLANTDLADINDADVVILFTVDPTIPMVRGGRHFEAGYAYAYQEMLDAPDIYRLITVGPRENIFHHLDDILNFPNWGAALAWLKEDCERRNRLEQSGERVAGNGS